MANNRPKVTVKFEAEYHDFDEEKKAYLVVYRGPFDVDYFWFHEKHCTLEVPNFEVGDIVRYENGENIIQGQIETWGGSKIIDELGDLRVNFKQELQRNIPLPATKCSIVKKHGEK